MRYKDAVAEARRLVKRSEEDQWRLAELTWQQVEAGKTRGQWARDVGIVSQWAETLYKIWARFANVRREDRPYFWDAVAVIRQDVDDPDAARQIERDKLAQRTVRNASPEQRAALVRELLEDDKVASDPAVEAAAIDLAASTPSRTARTIERADENRPAPRPKVTDPNALEITAALGVGSAAIVAMRKLAPDVSTLVAASRNADDDDKEAIREDVTKLRKARDMAGVYADEIEISLEGGVSDDRLQALLEGGL